MPKYEVCLSARMDLKECIERYLRLHKRDLKHPTAEDRKFLDGMEFLKLKLFQDFGLEEIF
jgi:hypothetical protein